VTAKGMISWETQLSPKEMQQVSSFVYSLEGTTPENPKEPQGELFERESGEDEAGDDDKESETEGETTTDKAEMASYY